MAGNETMHAVVLAGERGPGDPLAQQSGTCCKALVEVAGQPMVLRVLNALGDARLVGGRMLSASGREVMLAACPPLAGLVSRGEVTWSEAGPSPSISAWQAMQDIPDQAPVLVTTGDHPLLSTSIIDEFCAKSLATGADLTVGLAPYPLIHQAFPEMKKTVLRFRDGEYCGCNLFAFLTPNGRRVAEFWRRVESERKNPLRLIRLLGWGAVARYLLGRLTLDRALALLSSRLGLTINAIMLPYAEAAVDVDSVSDHEIVQASIESR